MQIYELNELTEDKRRAMKYRSAQETRTMELFPTVNGIAEEVRTRGDEAVIEATLRHDRVALTVETLRVQEREFESAWQSIDKRLIASLELSIDNHRRYNERLMPPQLQLFELGPGIVAGRKTCPLDSVALFVPSGKGSYPSTFVTIAVPAIVAGVKNIHLLVPPRSDGSVDPAILAAARLLGIGDVYRANGIAGTLAFAFGNGIFPRVDKIVGPGSPYIVAAQMVAQLHGVATTLGFGPSECMIIADDSADASFIAADLINEAEHGMDSSAILLTDSRPLAEEVRMQASIQLSSLPEWRRKYAEAALANGGIVVVEHLDQAVALANEWGNEHIQVATRNPWNIAHRLTGAAELLIGQSTTFSAISYAIGVPACLPTGPFARIHSGVTVDTFLRYSAVTELSSEGLEQLAGCIATLSEYEGFPAHARSVAIRKQKGMIG